MGIQYIQGVVPMKEKINYNNCMKRKCQECKYYNYCFGHITKESHRKFKKSSYNRKKD